MTSANPMHEAGNPRPVFWDNPEGWGGKGENRGVQNGGTHVYYGCFMSMYDKNHHN